MVRWKHARFNGKIYFSIYSQKFLPAVARKEEKKNFDCFWFLAYKMVLENRLSETIIDPNFTTSNDKSSKEVNQHKSLKALSTYYTKTVFSSV